MEGGVGVGVLRACPGPPASATVGRLHKKVYEWERGGDAGGGKGCACPEAAKREGGAGLNVGCILCHLYWPVQFPYSPRPALPVLLVASYSVPARTHPQTRNCKHTAHKRCATNVARPCPGTQDEAARAHVDAGHRLEASVRSPRPRPLPATPTDWHVHIHMPPGAAQGFFEHVERASFITVATPHLVRACFLGFSPLTRNPKGGHAPPGARLAAGFHRAI